MKTNTLILGATGGIGALIPFIGNNAILFGVVAGFYWALGLRALSRKLFAGKSMKVAPTVLILLS